MPVDRDTFTQVQQRVIASAPAGLSRDQFNELLDSELAKAQKPALIAAPPGPKPGTMQSELDRFQNFGGWQDVAVGAARSVAGTAAGIGKLVGANGPLQHTLEHAAQPTNDLQQTGKTVGNAAQFFLPGAAIGKIKTALATGSGVLDALIGAGLEGASGAGVQTAQQGTTVGAKKTAAVTAATGLAVPAALKGLGVLGERIESALLKPSVAVSEGVTPRELSKNVFKYDVGGTLGQSYDKVQAKLTTLYSHLRTVLSKSTQADVDLKDVYDATLKSYAGNEQAKAALSRIMDSVEFGLNKHGIPMNASVVNLADANVAKQAVGEMGAWLHDPTGRVISDADRITEDVANRFYGHLKTQIEQKASGPVKALNAAMSDLIPIKTAIIRRIPIEQRANVLNLGDLIGLSTNTLGLSLANRLLKSGVTANVFAKAGQMAEPVGAAAARGAGATSVAIPTGAR